MVPMMDAGLITSLEYLDYIVRNIPQTFNQMI